MQVTDPEKYNTLSMGDLNAIWSQVKPHIIKKIDPKHPHCIITDYAPATNGRPQVRYKGVKYYISIVLCLRKYRLLNPDYKIQVGDECSHLCHHPPCINSKWLVFESGDLNKTRNCCLMFGNIDGYYCPHTPVCPGCKGVL